MNVHRTYNDMAAIEDALAALGDVHDEYGRHILNQKHLVAQLPAELQAQVLELLIEQEQTMAYINYQTVKARKILLECRPSPYAYDPNRPAIRPRRPERAAV